MFLIIHFVILALIILIILVVSRFSPLIGAFLCLLWLILGFQGLGDSTLAKDLMQSTEKLVTQLLEGMTSSTFNKCLIAIAIINPVLFFLYMKYKEVNNDKRFKKMSEDRRIND